MTREEYMSFAGRRDLSLHREYFSQFVNDNVKISVLANYSKDELTKALEEDEHLNGIPLRKWDNMWCPVSHLKLKEAGESWTLSTKVCILKEAARQIIES